MTNQELTQYSAWRLWPVHFVARLFGVLVHVDGMPFGSSRLHRSAGGDDSSAMGAAGPRHARTATDPS